MPLFGDTFSKTGVAGRSAGPKEWLRRLGRLRVNKKFGKEL